MRKKNGILIPLIAISTVLILGYKGFGWENNFKDTELGKVVGSFASREDLRQEETWQVFEQYLEFARTHNLLGLKSLSHQISPACADPAKEQECFALMDSVYGIAGNFKSEDFRHIESDERQILLYTDGPLVTILLFTKDSAGNLKILGLNFCVEDENTKGSCVETDPTRRDRNNNGWWDSVEALFYSTSS